jgi:hypothetical protein
MRCRRSLGDTQERVNRLRRRERKYQCGEIPARPTAVQTRQMAVAAVIRERFAAVGRGLNERSRCLFVSAGAKNGRLWRDRRQVPGHWGGPQHDQPRIEGPGGSRRVAWRGSAAGQRPAGTDGDRPNRSGRTSPDTGTGDDGRSDAPAAVGIYQRATRNWRRRCPRWATRSVFGRRCLPPFRRLISTPVKGQKNCQWDQYHEGAGRGSMLEADRTLVRTHKMFIISKR